MINENFTLRLSSYLLSKATLCGNEYAWPIELIPQVIKEAENQSLLNVGGQLQFRLPQGTCECYWVDVDTYKSVPNDISWEERVRLASHAALEEFNIIQQKYDFEKEGQEAFGDYIEAFTASGGNLRDVMCFVWYLIGR